MFFLCWNTLTVPMFAAEPVESKRDNPSAVVAAGVNFPGYKQQPKDTAATGQDTNTGEKLIN